MRPIFLQQLRFKLFHLTARRARQILSIAFADCRQVLFAHDAAIEHPDPARLAVLALHHAQNRLHGRDVAAVAVKGFVAEWETFLVHDERDHQLLAVGPVIAGIAATNHWVLLRRAFHIGAGQVVEQHIELGAEQRAVAFFQVPLQLRFVRQNAVQTAVETRVVDLAIFDPQQIVERGGWIPALLDGQFAAGRAEAIDRQQSRHARPRHIGGLIVHGLLEETWMDMDSAVHGPLVQRWRLLSADLFIDSRVCSTLLSDTFSRQCPCVSLSLHLHQVE